MKRGLIINELAVSEEAPRARQWRDDKPASRPRIFDHLNDEPEAASFREAAKAMRKSKAWLLIPARDEPATVAGELTGAEP